MTNTTVTNNQTNVTTTDQVDESLTRTDNGAVTNATSLNKNVDLFFTIGASRGKDPVELQKLFDTALHENFEIAVRILLWSRDVRGGAGERQIFKDLMNQALTYLKNESSENRIQNFMDKVVEVGRWDDLIALFFNTDFEYHALRKIRHGLLVEGNALAGKWMPRPKHSKEANKIRSFLKMTPSEYRKLLVNLSDTVEQKMCAKEWGKINYEHVPSLAQARYTQAFMRNDGVRYQQYLDSLAKGESKVNTAAVYPYDVIKTLNFGKKSLANSQWDNLPNYCEGNDGNVLPVVDTSGSMGTPVGGNSNLTCIDVAVSLGLYLSERLGGKFKDHFVTFSANPEMQRVKGDLASRYHSMRRAEWGMNTDVIAVFETLLAKATEYGASENIMPKTVLILSDMQFDMGTRSMYSMFDRHNKSHKTNDYNKSTMDSIKARYETAGYGLPNIVWWNLNASMGNVPVSFDEQGTALVSGFSPSIMKSILGGEDMTPNSIMMETVMVDRYKV